MLDDAELANGFPLLDLNAYRNSSPPSDVYNCLAWAAGRDDKWWEPAVGAGYYWPPGAPFDYSIIAAIKVYEGLGFSICPNSDHEDQFEKVAIYGETGDYTHAARELPNGKWTSKLGRNQDIEHDNPEALVGGDYGQIVGFMKRPLAP